LENAAMVQRGERKREKRRVGGAYVMMLAVNKGCRCMTF
jgi:hypothetical protein